MILLEITVTRTALYLFMLGNKRQSQLIMKTQWKMVSGRCFLWYSFKNKTFHLTNFMIHPNLQKVSREILSICYKFRAWQRRILPVIFFDLTYFIIIPFNSLRFNENSFFITWGEVHKKSTNKVLKI